jgi:hypothetical protein
MSITSRRNEVNIHASSSSIPDSLYNLAQSQILEDSDNDDNDFINHLDIAEGLKKMLVMQGLKLESLLVMRPDDLAEMLGIDEYVAKIITSAAYDMNKKVKASMFHVSNGDNL